MNTITIQITLPQQKGTLELVIQGDVTLVDNDSHGLIFTCTGAAHLTVDDLSKGAREKALVTSVHAKENQP